MSFSASAKRALLASEGWSHIPPNCRPSKTVGRDDSRPLLCHGYIRHDGDGIFLDCTDSYVLTRIPVDVPGATPKDRRERIPEGYIDVGSLELIDKSRTGAFRVNEDGLIEVDGYRALYPRPDLGDFPDASKLIPGSQEGSVETFGINPTLLARVADALGCRGHGGAVRLDFIAPMRPVVVSSTSAGPAGLIGVVMPVRLEI